MQARPFNSSKVIRVLLGGFGVEVGQHLLSGRPFLQRLPDLSGCRIADDSQVRRASLCSANCASQRRP
jgi:hypothetical protein